jgi:putative tricarboxylic transport membrane protein
MDLFSHLALGFSVAVSPVNIGLCLVGALLGTLIGVLPGIGPMATIAMLLPVTYGLDPTGALIMLAGIYYGAQYGGSTTAILVNLPGEASSVVTTLDGHQMARQGRAGTALAIAAIGSFVAGTAAVLLLALVAVPLTGLVRIFGPAEYFSLMVLGLVCAIVLSSGSLAKSFLMIGLGLLLSSVGSDLETGQARLTFGFIELSDGIDFVVLAMGIFGFGEIMRNLEDRQRRDLVDKPIDGLMPKMRDLKQAAPAIGRGTVVGSLLGILPGGGSILGAYASYMLEKKVAKDPSRFGRGAIEGVAGPESANNAASQTSFIPLLTLGIPSNAVLALMVGAMMIHDIVPGPDIIAKQPALFWGLIVSMWIGNIMLLVINLPLIGIWVRVLRVPYRLLFPAIVLFCCIGIYSISNQPFDVVLSAIFGVFGYLLLKFGFEPAPLVLSFVLGPLLEDNMRRALLMSRGDWMVFAREPISLGLLLVAAVAILVALLPAFGRRRQVVFTE